MTLDELIANFGNLCTDYSAQVNHSLRVQVHANGTLCYPVLRFHDMEDGATRAWRASNFTPLTRTPFNRSFNSLSRILSDSDYTWDISEDLQQYITSSKFMGADWNTFFGYVLRVMIVDPNAFLVWSPVVFEGATENQKVDVFPEFVRSDMVQYVDSETLIWLTKEKSEVWTGNIRQMEGNVYIAHTKKNIIRFVQIGQKSEETYEWTILYEKITPVKTWVILGGEWCEEGLFKTFFDAFLDVADDAINIYSDWQFSMKKCGYPTRVVRPITCQTCNGTGHHGDGDCRKCNGNGTVDLSGPSKSYILEEPAGLGGTVDERPVLQYIAPPTDILQYQFDSVKELLHQCEKALMLNYIDEAQSGTAKQIDREESYAFLRRVSTNFYDSVMYSSLNAINILRNPQNAGTVTVMKPTSFVIQTIDELQQQMKDLAQYGNPSLMNITLDMLVQKRFSGDLVAYKKVKFLMWYDVYYQYTIEQKLDMLQGGVMSIEQANKSTQAAGTLERVVSDVGSKEFLAMSYTEIASMVDNYIQPVQILEVTDEQL